MKPLSIALIVICGLALADTRTLRDQAQTGGFPQPGVEVPLMHRAGGNLSARVAEVRARLAAQDGVGVQSAGNLWIEVDRLKREGQPVRTLEWLVSDLDGSLRRGPQAASARRHILNNLEHEIQVLRARNR